MSNAAESVVYEFGEFRFNADKRRLFRLPSGELVPLQPKAAELLFFLLTNRERILTKNEILDAVWEDNFVEESNLSQTIFVLRKALHETSKEPRFILTAPSRGYRFIADVKTFHPDEMNVDRNLLSVSRAGEAASGGVHVPSSNIQTKGLKWLAVPIIFLISLAVYWFYPKPEPAGLSGIRTIAILPFEDLSVEKRDKYLGLSIADVLASRFGGLQNLVVRPTRSVLKYADSREDPGKMGSELQVDAVLDGRIQRVGERIRVNVQLIRVADNFTIWTGNFEDQFTNFFAVQDSMSRQIAQSLSVRLDEKELQRFSRKGTENAEAYQEYLLGRFFWNKRSAHDLDQAIVHFERALELDNNFALAYAGLAETYAIYPFYAVDHDKDSLPKARVAATKALEIDGELSEAYTVLAYVQSQYDFDWNTAENSYLRAVALNPNHATTRQWYGEFLAFQARFDESLTQMQKAIELDPTSLSANTAPALTYNASGQFEKSLETLERVLQMDAKFLIARHYKSRALFFSGRRDEGIALHRQVVEDSNGTLHFKADLGFMLAKAGNELAARRILADLHDEKKRKHVSPYYLAIIHIGMGEKERAFEFLRQAVAEHDNNVIVMKVGLNFEELRQDPAFIEILKTANF